MPVAGVGRNRVARGHGPVGIDPPDHVLQQQQGLGALIRLGLGFLAAGHQGREPEQTHEQDDHRDQHLDQGEPGLPRIKLRGSRHGQFPDVLAVLRGKPLKSMVTHRGGI